MMSELEAKVTSADFAGKVLSAGSKSYKVKEADNYKYTDPIDNSVATKQVPFILFINIIIITKSSHY